MDGDLISRKELRDLWPYNGLNEHIYCTNDVLDSIDEQPAVDAEPVRHGRWIHLGGDEWRCTMCGQVISTAASAARGWTEVTDLCVTAHPWRRTSRRRGRSTA
nr:MAG TPA: Halobacterial output domain 2 [Caudoviricetes sp.]